MTCLLLLLAGCSDNTDTPGGSENSGGNTDTSIVTPPSAPDASTNRPTRPATTKVTLTDGDIKIEGAGASASGSTLSISADGVYEVSGTLSDGQIIINAPDAAIVELVLSGVNISNSKNSAIYCKNCDDFIITLAENTQNVLNDAKSYTYDDVAKQEPNAALFSKTDMNIGGSGWLTVNANFNHGISSKDDLVIEGGGYIVTSAADAIRGKDSLVILNGKFELNAGDDGLQASSIDGDEFGYVQIVNGEYTIKACGDAIQAETTLTALGGTFDITTEGTPSGKSDSQKGLKAGTLLTVENGTFKIISKDDAVHSDVDIKIENGTFHIETGDDGIHANRNLYINGGDINIPKCYEGFEGTIIEVNGGKAFINALNDAIGAAAGTPEAEKFTGRGGNPNVQVWFNGGEVEAVSGGDTVDSNGNIYVTGGTLRLSSPPYPDYEGSLLCNGDVTISGGNLAAVGCMGVNVYCAEQPVLWVSHVKQLSKGTVLSLKDESGNVLLELTTRDNAVQSSYTSPDSLIERGIENELIAVARKLGVKVLAFGTVGHGLLSDNILNASVNPRMARGLLAPEYRENNLEMIRKVKGIADEKGISLSQLALAWSLAKYDHVQSLIGTTNLEHLQSAIDALQIELTKEDIERIEATIPVDKIGGKGMRNFVFTNGKMSLA